VDMAERVVSYIWDEGFSGFATLSGEIASALSSPMDLLDAAQNSCTKLFGDTLSLRILMTTVVLPAAHLAGLTESAVPLVVETGKAIGRLAACEKRAEVLTQLKPKLKDLPKLLANGTPNPNDLKVWITAVATVVLGAAAVTSINNGNYRKPVHDKPTAAKLSAAKARGKTKSILRSSSRGSRSSLQYQEMRSSISSIDKGETRASLNQTEQGGRDAPIGHHAAKRLVRKLSCGLLSEDYDERHGHGLVSDYHEEVMSHLLSQAANGNASEQAKTISEQAKIISQQRVQIAKVEAELRQKEEEEDRRQSRELSQAIDDMDVSILDDADPPPIEAQPVEDSSWIARLSAAGALFDGLAPPTLSQTKQQQQKKKNYQEFEDEEELGVSNACPQMSSPPHQLRRKNSKRDVYDF